MASLWLATLSCDESLPPRDEPEKFLQATYSIATGTVEIRDSMVFGLAGGFVVSVKNINTEVLQDVEAARVELDVWLRDSADVRTKVVATKRELTDPSFVSGGLFTLRPNVSANFLKQWDHRTASGKPFWEYVPMTLKYDEHGNPYFETDSVRFVAKGKVQLFKTKAPELLPQIQFTLVYRFPS